MKEKIRMMEIVLIISGILLVVCSSCGSDMDADMDEISLSELENGIALKNSLVDPVSFYNNAEKYLDYIIDVDNVSDGWTELSIEGADLSPSFVKEYDNYRSTVMLFDEKDKDLGNEGTVSTIWTVNLTEDYQPSAEDSLSLFASLYNDLSNELGEAEIYNIDEMYSSSVNVDPVKIENCLFNQDTSHTYYVEWNSNAGYRVGITYWGTGSVLPISTSISIYYY